MSSKTVDVDLRIRAKNLSKTALKDLTKEVDDLTQSQTEQAKAADLASRSMKDLLAEQQKAAALTRELTSRRGLAQRYADERAEIERLSKKVVELTALRQQAAASADKMIGGKGLKELDREILQVNKSLNTMVGRVEKTQAKLEAVGVSTENLSGSMIEIANSTGKANVAYDAATANVIGYAAAVDRANAIQAEATRRTLEEAAARARLVDKSRQDAGARGVRTGELASLRADIEQRSQQARAIEVATEAQRRLRVEQELEASTIAKNNAAVRDSVRLLEQRRQKQAELEDVFGRQLTLQERERKAQDESNARRQRLIALIQSEKGQRLLGLEAQRRETAETEKGSGAKDRSAAATRRAAKEEAFFQDTGRKSLSIYQRMRGQLLGLAAAYIGVYQVVNTFSSAIDAVNRNQGLQIGLLTANEGDAKAAASDYQFLREEADRLGLVFDDIAPKFANMAISAKDLNISGEQTRQMFTNIATAIAANNLSVDDAEGVFRAFGQVLSKARVQAEELRGQLGDRLPGAVAAFAAANNIALSDLDKALKSGELGVDELIKFAEGYANKFAPVMEQATTRLSASIARARNAYNDWLRDVLNSSNQNRLKQAFAAIETFFKGREGEKFAEAIGKAFSFAVKVFLILADNIDLVVKAFKIFLAVQVIKFGIDAANSIAGLVTQMTALASSSAAASTSATAAAGSLGRVKLAAIGIAGVLLAITEALNSQSTALDNVSDKYEDYIDLLDKVGRRQGIAKAASVDEAKKNIEAIQQQRQQTDAQIKQLKAFQADFTGKNGLLSSYAADIKVLTGNKGIRELGIGPLSDYKDIQNRINTLQAQSVELRRAETAELEIQSDLTFQELAQAEAPKGPKPAKKPKAEKTPKTPKGPDPEDEARRREAAEDAAAKKIIQIQGEIQDAKINTAATTDAQIKANFDATIANIDLDIKKKQLELEAIRRQSDNAGVDNSSRIAEAEKLLIVLREAQTIRAQEEMVQAQVEIRDKAINDLIAQRNAKIELANTLKETGQISELEAYTRVNAAQEEYNVQIRALVEEFMAFIGQLDPEGELYKRLGLDRVKSELQVINAEAAKLSNAQLFSRKFGGEIAAGFGQAFGALAKGLAGALQNANSLSDAFKAAGDAFLNFAADFLINISQMIIEALILQAIQNAISGGSGGYGQAVGNALFGSAHSGGVVRGNSRVGTNPRRNVPITAFAGAEKFHDGGLPGLKRSEVAIIAKKNEEVLSEDDPRNVLNGGLQPGGGGGDVTVINSIDSASVIKQGYAEARGTVLNDMRANAASYRKAMGVK